MQAEEERRDKLHGLSLGHAMGDAIGGPTSLARVLAQSLLENRGFCSDQVRRDYLNWWREDGHDCGPVFDRVLTLVNQGKSWQSASEIVNTDLKGMTGGCNPAHRAMPLVFLDVSDTELVPIAVNEARLTHRDPIAGVISAATVVICRKLIEGYSFGDAIKKVQKAFPDNADLIRILNELENLSTRDLKSDGYAPNTLRAALFFVNETPDFDTALERAFEFAGTTNYCPVLVGAMAGARSGAAAIRKGSRYRTHPQRQISDPIRQLA